MINELAIWQLNEFEISSVCPTLSLSLSQSAICSQLFFKCAGDASCDSAKKSTKKKTRGVAGKLCGLESSFACISPALPLLFPFFFFCGCNRLHNAAKLLPRPDSFCGCCYAHVAAIVNAARLAALQLCSNKLAQSLPFSNDQVLGRVTRMFRDLCWQANLQAPDRAQWVT